ncbi:MAG: DUF805 domain-containing protein [Pseudomonadota bacterium]
MDFGNLYLSADGRISRKTWWLGAIGVVVISIIVGAVFGAIGGVIGFTGSAFGIGILSLVSLAILFVPYRSLTYKRLHDRNRPENLFWIFLAPSIISPLLQMFGLSGGIGEVEFFGQSVETFQPNMLGNLISLASFGVMIWMIIELGVMKGDEGDNAHGPDPLT